jgi:hypothetical protein
MLISAIPSGNHYLTDVLGGLAVAVLAIVCGRRVQESFDRLISGTVWNLQSSVQSRRSRISTGENSLRSAQFGGCISRSSTRTFLAGIETLSGYAARAPYGPAVSASDRTRYGTTRCATYGRAAKMVKAPQAPQGAPSPLPPPCLEVRCHSAKGGGNVTHLGRRRDRRRHHSKSGLAPVALMPRVRRFRRDRGAAATLSDGPTNQPRISVQYIKSGRHLAWPAGNRRLGAGRSQPTPRPAPASSEPELTESRRP